MIFMSKHIQKIKDWLGAGSINIFGRPFSGKDTQGEIVAALLDGHLIGGGDILRSHHDPKKVEEIMASGGIVPSDFYEELILPYFSRRAFAGKPLILSAVGRSHGEEPMIMRTAKQAEHPIKAVIVLDLPAAEVWQRFAESQADHDRGRRADDRREVLKTRLQKFEERTVPVLKYYRDRGLLIRVDGTKPRKQVTAEILAALEKLADRPA
jgi:adenylate kinase